MRLWSWFGAKARKDDDDRSSITDDQLEKIDSSIHDAEEKLAQTKAQLPDLSKAVASARRVKYRVDGFTKAMYDESRGVNHG